MAKLIWTAEMDALLGTDTDATVAKTLGIAQLVVWKRRTVLGIHKSGHWTAEMDALLGTATDIAVAAKLRLCNNTVSLRRHTLGIPRFDLKPPESTWTPEVVARFSTCRDRDIAYDLGVSIVYVTARRNRLGLPKFVCLRQQARKLLAEHEEQLGKISDVKMAVKLGVSSEMVRQYRKKRGIGKFGSITWTPETDALLGTMSDNDLALQLSASRIHITRRRIQLGIRKAPAVASGPVRKDISNLRFGRWTVLHHLEGRYWMCRCDCGREVSVANTNLRSGMSWSCGNHGCRKKRSERIEQPTQPKEENRHVDSLPNSC